MAQDVVEVDRNRGRSTKSKGINNLNSYPEKWLRFKIKCPGVVDTDLA